MMRVSMFHFLILGLSLIAACLSGCGPASKADQTVLRELNNALVPHLKPSATSVRPYVTLTTGVILVEETPVLRKAINTPNKVLMTSFQDVDEPFPFDRDERVMRLFDAEERLSQD